MAYQLYKKMKQSGNGSLEPNHISVTPSSFGLGSTITHDMKKAQCDYISIYVDEEKNLIGLKPTKDKSTGYKIMYKKSKIIYVGSRKLLKRIKKGRYPARKEEDLWVIEAPIN